MKGLIPYIKSTFDSFDRGSVNFFCLDEACMWPTNKTSSKIIMSVKDYYKMKRSGKNKKTIKRMLCQKH